MFLDTVGNLELGLAVEMLKGFEVDLNQRQTQKMWFRSTDLSHLLLRYEITSYTRTQRLQYPLIKEYT